MFNLHLLNETFTNGYWSELLDFISLASILCGIFVIISKNPVVSVLFLIGLFLNISGYLIMLGINFIGLSYLLVYVGAVSILFLFILMLINVRLSELYFNHETLSWAYNILKWSLDSSPPKPHAFVSSPQQSIVLFSKIVGGIFGAAALLSMASAQTFAPDYVNGTFEVYNNAVFLNRGNFGINLWDHPTWTYDMLSQCKSNWLQLNETLATQKARIHELEFKLSKMNELNQSKSQGVVLGIKALAFSFGTAYSVIFIKHYIGVCLGSNLIASYLDPITNSQVIVWVVHLEPVQICLGSTNIIWLGALSGIASGYYANIIN